MALHTITPANGDKSEGEKPEFRKKHVPKNQKKYQNIDIAKINSKKNGITLNPEKIDFSNKNNKKMLSLNHRKCVVF